jgi:hypothetical protein
MEKSEIVYSITNAAPNYKCTNESIEAILLGMDVKPEDNILCIMGSGQQGLAMAGEGANVTLIERSKSQADYFSRLFSFLSDEKNQNELCRDILVEISRAYKSPKSYFSDLKKIADIRKNLFRINNPGQTDMFEAKKGISGYNKVYLSNALTIGEMYYPRSLSVFKDFGGRFKEGTLFYATRRFTESDDEIKPPFYIEKTLTEIARELERSSWDPRVIIKNENYKTVGSL